MKKSVMKLVKNKYVFYAAVVFAVLNVVGYVSMRSWECVVMFAAVAYATRCYTKNDTIAILAGIFVSNFIFGCNRVKEGFEEAIDGTKGLVDKALEKLKKECQADDTKTWNDDTGKCEGFATREGFREAHEADAAKKEAAKAKLGDAQDLLNNLDLDALTSTMDKMVGAMKNMGK
jgi:hypothetical protein